MSRYPQHPRLAACFANCIYENIYLLVVCGFLLFKRKPFYFEIVYQNKLQSVQRRKKHTRRYCILKYYSIFFFSWNYIFQWIAMMSTTHRFIIFLSIKWKLLKLITRVIVVTQYEYIIRRHRVTMENV